MFLDDVGDVLRRLEEGGPGLANPPRCEPRPAQVRDMARMWVEECGWRRGEFKSPPPVVLAVAFQRWLDARGWDVKATAHGVASALRQRFRRMESRGTTAYMMREEDVRGLWLLAEEVAPHVVARRKARRPKKRGTLGPRLPPPFHPVPVQATPLISSAGEVFPSFVVAGQALRVAPRTVNMAARRGGSAAGRLWRYLTREEVGMVPAEARAGDRVPALLGCGTVSGLCTGCGGSFVAVGRAGGGTPLPGFPPPPGGAEAGGPSHTFSVETE